MSQIKLNIIPTTKMHPPKHAIPIISYYLRLRAIIRTSQAQIKRRKNSLKYPSTLNQVPKLKETAEGIVLTHS